MNNQIPPSSSAGTGLGLPTTSGESCPYGTVPIRRTLKEDLVRRRASSQVMKPQTEYTEHGDVSPIVRPGAV